MATTLVGNPRRVADCTDTPSRSQATRSARGGRRTLLGLATGLVFAASVAHAQQQVTGHVVDVEGNVPVPGAAVTVLGTTIGTVTNDSGAFHLKIPTGAATLTARRIGFKPRSIPIAADQTDVTIALTRDVLELEATIVTGQATSISSQNSAVSIASVNTEDLNRVPAPTVENALQGRIAGATVQQNNGGAPGGGLQIQIRGITSINANAQPLYVIDGVIIDNGTTNPGVNAISGANGNNVGVAPDIQDNGVNRVADLNPQDIENIEILKGSAASAIYGSRAASGVIVITTKKGSPGRPKWDLQQKLGTFEQAKELPLLQFPTLASAQTWAANYTGLTPAEVAANYSGNHNFQAELFGNHQLANETDLSVRGATENTQYFVSALTKYDNGIMLNTGYNKQSVRTNVTQNLSSTLSATANLYYAHDLTRRGFTGNDNVGGSPYAIFAFTPQFYNLDSKLPDGNYVPNLLVPANAFQDAYGIQTPDAVSRFIGGGNITWKPIQTDRQTVTFTAQGGADLSSETDQLFAPPSLYLEQSQNLPGVATTQNATTNLINYSLNAVHHYAGGVNFDATTSIGFTRDKSNLFNPSTVGQDLLSGVNSPTVGSVTTTYLIQSAIYNQSLYAQEQIMTLHERLTLTAGLTGERSTNDGDVGKFYLYPKYSASYRVPQFLSGLDDFKLRAAYGVSGTLPNYFGVVVPPGQQSSVKYNSQLVGTISGLVGSTTGEVLGDSTIRPETNTEIETGFDASMLGSRLNVSATVYQKRITDLLLNANIAGSQGVLSQWLNGGQFTNQGIELSLDVTPVQMHNGLTWVSHTTFYRNYSRVDALPVPAFPVGNFFGSNFGSFEAQVGRSVSQIIGNVCTAGTVTTTAATCTGQSIVGAQVGDAQPNYTMGFGNEFNFRHFHAYALLDYSNGGVIANLTNGYFDGLHTLADTAASSKRDAAVNTPYTCIGTYCEYIESATYLKLREVTLSYDLPDSWVQRITFFHVSSARLQLSGRNLWRSYKYSGLDPEVSVFGAQNISRAQDITPYPPARSYFVSLAFGL